MKKRIAKANEHIRRNKNKVDNKYRHNYHFMGEIGWINDPNGLSMYNGEYHLFYQYHPYKPIWGPMHWGHAKSNDLVKWEHLPVALAPLSFGIFGGAAFSGSAIEHEGKHYLMYTENWFRKQVQSIAVSSDGINYKRITNKPVITGKSLPNGCVKADFRDPKIWKKSNIFYSVIGSRASDKSGQIAMFKSTDLKSWEFVNIICKSENKIGKMWECPDLFELDGKDILIMSPQYLPTDGDRFYNIHSSTYMVGKLDYEKGKYDYKDYEEIDSGFDFYAPQTFLDNKGRRIMIAWMAMWSRNIPTRAIKHNWAGSMTLPRVLSLRDGKLIQTPIKEIENYRTNEENYEGIITGENTIDIKAQVSELLVTITNDNAKNFGLKLFQNDEEGTVITYDTYESKLIFDRSKSGIELKGNSKHETNSNIRKVKVDLINKELKLRIFLDKSSIEIFIHDGVSTMTSTVYLNDDSNNIVLFTKGGKSSFNIKKWDIVIY